MTFDRNLGILTQISNLFIIFAHKIYKIISKYGTQD